MQRLGVLKFGRKDVVDALLKFAAERGDPVPPAGMAIDLIPDACARHGSHCRVALEWIERDYE